MAVIEVEKLTRIYRERRGKAELVALHEVDLQVAAGEVVGLLGPNGAGKTTLARILTTLLLPTSGRAAVAGHDVVAHPRRARGAVGLVLGGERGLYGRLSARQNLAYWAALCKLPRKASDARITELLGRLGLAERADEPVERFSRGMLQRVHLARALVADPAVLVLDEPTSGMDLNAALGFRRLVAALRDEGKAVLLNTHDMSEAEEVCGRVAFLDHGRIVGSGSPAELTRLLESIATVTGEHATRDTADELARTPGVVSSVCTPDGTITVVVHDRELLPTVLGTLAVAGVRGIATRTAGLAEIYRLMISDREFAV